MNLPTEFMNTISLVSFLVTIASIVLSVWLYFKEKLTTKDLEIEKKRYEDLRTNIHWQLQAIHHSCNRLENIIRDPNRTSESTIDVAKGIKDSASALMGQTLGKIHLFPWNNYPIVDPETDDVIGCMVGNRQRYRKDYKEEFPHKFDGALESSGKGSPNRNITQDSKTQHLSQSS